MERVSRYLCAVKLPGPTAQATLDAQLAIYRQLPAHAAASVTADNGSEFTLHHRLADTIGVPTYFADPYSAFGTDAWLGKARRGENGQSNALAPVRAGAGGALLDVE